MSKHTMDARGTTGYFLPEESHFRLKKLHGHMEFLSQLAQPRRDDEEDTGFGPEITGDEMAVCLELLAEQAGRVLDEVTWPAERKAVAQRPQARDEDDLDDWAEAEDADDTLAAAAEDDEAREPPPARPRADVRDAAPPADAQDAATADVEGAGLQAATEADEASAGPDSEDEEDAENGNDTAQPLRFGMTLDQLDALNRMHDRLHAYGDLVFGAERAELADGTLSTLGDVIFKEAEAASDLMDQVVCQSLPDPRYEKPRVREARAAYGAPDRAGTSGKAVPPPSPPMPKGWATSAATLH